MNKQFLHTESSKNAIIRYTLRLSAVFLGRVVNNKRASLASLYTCHNEQVDHPSVPRPVKIAVS